jgi:hypothetical protein
MKLISVRSPYFIIVNEASQVGSKVELFIWHKGETEPATATYTLSKKIASATQIKNTYNISNYAKEFINNISSAYNGFITEVTDDWVYVKVKRYKETSASNYTLLNTETYVACNGYTKYQDGFNEMINNTFIPATLYQQNKTYKFFYDDFPSIYFFIDYTNDADEYLVRYSNFEGIPNIDEETILNGETETQYLFSIPISLGGVDYVDGNKLEIVKNDVVIATYIFKTECEIKYSPITVEYINKYGGWDFITFFKARTENWEVKNKEYQLLPNDVDYNILIGQSKAFNYEAKQSIKVNTGWLNESYNELIKDLMVSETILLKDTIDASLQPVKLKTMSTDLKTSLQDKMINYQIEFEYNFNQINNVI